MLFPAYVTDAGEQAEVLGARVAGEIASGTSAGWRLDRGEGVELTAPWERERRFTMQVAHTIHLQVPLTMAAGDGAAGGGYRSAPTDVRTLRVDAAVSPNVEPGVVAGLTLALPLARTPRGPVGFSGRIFEGREDDVTPLNRDRRLASLANDALRGAWYRRGRCGISGYRPACGIDVSHGARLVVHALPHDAWLGFRTTLGLRPLLALHAAIERAWGG